MRFIFGTSFKKKYAAHSNGTPVNIICLMIEDDRKLVSYTGRRLRRGVPKNNNWILTGMGRKREGMGL